MLRSFGSITCYRSQDYEAIISTGKRYFAEIALGRTRFVGVFESSILLTASLFSSVLSLRTPFENVLSCSDVYRDGGGGGGALRYPVIVWLLSTLLLSHRLNSNYGRPENSSASLSLFPNISCKDSRDNNVLTTSGSLVVDASRPHFVRYRRGWVAKC